MTISPQQKDELIERLSQNLKNAESENKQLKDLLKRCGQAFRYSSNPVVLELNAFMDNTENDNV